MHSTANKLRLFVGTIVLLSSLPGVEVVLGLGHSVTKGGTLLPVLAGISSSFEVELSVIFKDACLLHVFFVVGGFLLVITVSDGLVLGGSQTGRNVRVRSNLCGLDLLRHKVARLVLVSE